MTFRCLDNILNVIIFLHPCAYFQLSFCDNLIKSSKYNIFTFWLINPLEQFRRVANFYFLIVAVIQLSLPESPVSPFTSVAPLVFVVITTMIKQVRSQARVPIQIPNVQFLSRQDEVF